MVEFTINQRPLDIVEQIIAHSPEIVSFGVYIWNISETTDVVTLLRAVRPDIKLIVGGPEVSYEFESSPLQPLVDFCIQGPGEIALTQLCHQLRANQAPPSQIIAGVQPDLKSLVLPYRYYDDDDLKQRIVYVEASRGCPFKCEFCLSSLDKTAYPFDLDTFLAEMDRLWHRGLRSYKFVDRTFNLKVATTLKILDFFLERIDENTFLHFELIPDHLPDTLKTKIAEFPAGSLQFEIGIQSFDESTQTRISRRQNNEKSKQNLAWLRENTQAHLHTDLIFGLPGEDMNTFADGFDQLVALNPHEIQLGILKRLRGTPIIRHTDEYQMVYNPAAPYNILQSDCVSFEQLQQINRFARYWDLIANSGRFEHSLPLILSDRPFWRFWALSNSIWQHSQQTHKIALPRLFKLLNTIVPSTLDVDAGTLEQALLADYAKSGQKGEIPFKAGMTQKQNLAANARQRRHLTS